MKTSFRLFAVLFSLGLLLVLPLAFVGCSSVSSTASTSPRGAIALRLTTSTAASLALAKNPAYVPAAAGLIAGIDAALAGEVSITPDVINAFVAQIVKQYNVSPADAALFTNLGLNVYRAYVDDFHPVGLIKITDPNVRAYVEAFKSGLKDAVSAYAPAS